MLNSLPATGSEGFEDTAALVGVVHGKKQLRDLFGMGRQSGADQEDVMDYVHLAGDEHAQVAAHDGRQGLEGFDRQEADIGFAARRLTLFGVLAAPGAVQRPALIRHPLVDGRDFYFNPPAAFTLQAGDQLIVLGRELSIQHLRAQVEASALARRPA